METQTNQKYIAVPADNALSLRILTNAGAVLSVVFLLTYAEIIALVENADNAVIGICKFVIFASIVLRSLDKHCSMSSSLQILSVDYVGLNSPFSISINLN